MKHVRAREYISIVVHRLASVRPTFTTEMVVTGLRSLAAEKKSHYWKEKKQGYTGAMMPRTARQVAMLMYHNQKAIGVERAERIQIGGCRRTLWRLRE